MDWLEIISKIFEVCIIPLLGILITYGIQWIKSIIQKIAIDKENEMLQKYIFMLTDAISSCVIATNQTYVEPLKAAGEFDEEAHKIALQLTYESILHILNDEAVEYLTNIYGDLSKYIYTLIEAEVNKNKA